MPSKITQSRTAARRTSARIRGALIAVVILASGLGALVMGPAAAAPTFDGGDFYALAPNAGGADTPVRVYGRNLNSVSEVRIGLGGGEVAANLTHIDDNLITAVAPPPLPAWIGAQVDVTLSADGGDFTLPGAFTYTNATVTATPDAGLGNGDAATVSAAAYLANTNADILLINPLLNYVEPRPTSYVPDRAALLAPLVPTDNAGGMAPTQVSVPASGTAPSASPCPPSQAEADVGLPRCSLAVSKTGVATVETPVAYEDNPVPAPPTALELSVSTPTAQAGTAVSVKAANMNGSPAFGSSTSFQTRAGATPLSIEICGIDSQIDNCTTAVTNPPSIDPSVPLPDFPTSANGTVGLTRLRDNTLSGATLDGTITIGSSFRSGCDFCFVRARQEIAGAPGTFLTSTAPLPIEAGGGVIPTTTTTAPPSSTSSTSSTTSTTLCAPWRPERSPRTSTTSSTSTTSTTVPESSTTTEPQSSTTSTRPVRTTTSTIPCPPEVQCNQWTPDPFSGTAGTVVRLYGGGRLVDITGIELKESAPPGRSKTIPRGATVSRSEGVTAALQREPNKFVRSPDPATRTIDVYFKVPTDLSGLLDITALGGKCERQLYEQVFFVRPVDLSFTIEPLANVSEGQRMVFSVRNYLANTQLAVTVLSPLIKVLVTEGGQNGPPDQLVGIMAAFGPPCPKPSDPANPVPFCTDNEGNLTQEFTLNLSTPGGIDPNARCPVLQNEANHGLLYCIISVSAFGTAILETEDQNGPELTFAGDLRPENPTVNVVETTARPNQSVTLKGGVNWWGQPKTGTTTVAELCGIGGDPENCQEMGPVQIPSTKYFYKYERNAAGQFKPPLLVGATLTETKLRVPAVTEGCTCTVRVRQPVDRAGEAPGDVIQGFDDLTVEVRAPANVTTTVPRSTTTTQRGVTTTTTTRLRGAPFGGNNGIGPNSPGAGVPPGQPVQVVGPGGGGGGAPANVLAPVVVPGIAPSPSPVQQRAPKGAVQQSNLMVRHVDKRSPAMSVAMAAGGAAMGAVGCLFVVGGRAVLGSRRRYTYNTSKHGRPRPRGAY